MVSFDAKHQTCALDSEPDGLQIISGCGGTADALVSGSSEEIRVGSNPVIRTKQRGCAPVVRPFLFYKDRDLK